MLNTLLSVIRAILVELVDQLLPQGLHPGVKTDSRRNILGIILAAAAAILCTIIDQVMKEE